MKLFKKKFDIGLALSGGAVRGIAHLGVLQALNEKKVKIGILAGTSAGSLVGALYSQGYSPKEILKIFSKKKIYDLIRVGIPHSGFFKVNGLRKVLEENLDAKNIEDLPVPLIITLTNLRDARVEYMTEGPLVDSLIASASIPTLFEVTTIKGIPYVDGGVFDNLPVQPLKDKCKKIIAVYTNPVGKLDKVKHAVQVAERSFHMAIAAENVRKRELVDLYIEPPRLKDYGMFDLKRAREIFDIGYEATLEALEENNF